MRVAVSWLGEYLDLAGRTVEEIDAAMFDASGLEDVEIDVIRKRSSKRELFEYVVRARNP